MDRLEHLKKFLQQPHYKISLMGMSGVGKTTLSRLLPSQKYFHYSVDYRIGTRYLNEEINDYLKVLAMQQPLLAELLRDDAIVIHSNLTIDNLMPLSIYLGMVGNLQKGGSTFEAFTRRLELHRQAEIAATRDVVHFIERAKTIYNYDGFLCDTSGSLCEINDEETWKILAQNTLLVYIQSTDEQKKSLIQRSVSNPKPLFYQHAFLEESLNVFLAQHHLNDIDEIDPKAFSAWIFPKLIEHRLPQYEYIANRYGITLSAKETANIQSEEAFIALIKRRVQEALDEKL